MSFKPAFIAMNEMPTIMPKLGQADSGGGADGATRHARGNVAARGAAEWLSLAAAPTFLIMALLTAVLDGGVPDVLCASAQHASLLTGMIPMYVLMGAFHLAPWLRLISSWRSGARRS